MLVNVGKCVQCFLCVYRLIVIAIVQHPMTNERTRIPVRGIACRSRNTTFLFVFARHGLGAMHSRQFHHHCDTSVR